MTEPLTFRAAARADLEAIVALLADDALGATREDPSVPLDPGYERAFASIASDPAHDLLIAERGEVLMGVLQLSVLPNLTYRGRPRAQIEGVRVSAAARGQGIGGALVEEAVRRAEAAGCHLVQLTTDKQRPEALRFYEGLGFVASHEGMKLRLP